jgi:hypothetical protein
VGTDSLVYVSRVDRRLLKSRGGTFSVCERAGIKLIYAANKPCTFYRRNFDGLDRLDRKLGKKLQF